MARHLPTKILSLLLLGSLSLALSGCDLKLPPMPWDPPPKETPAEGEEAPVETEGGGVEIEPVDLSKLLPETMRNLPYEEVIIPMRDRLELYGRLYDPSMKMDGEGDTISPGEEEAEYTGPKYPLVILLHGLNRSHMAWNDLPAQLVQAGYAVYAVDLRGHGKSMRTTKGRRTNWRLLTAQEWQLLPQDINQVITYFQKAQEDYPEVTGDRVALIGEKLGANVATAAAKKNTSDVQALVLLSPGLVYKGIDASRGLMGYSHPVLILVGQDEEEAKTTAQHLYNWIEGPKILSVYKTGQGTDILTNSAASSQQIRDWMMDKMPSTGPSQAAEPSASPTEMTPPETGPTESAPKPAATHTENPAHNG
ncbi:MAG TPA: alpha/beta fold hydrolase [Coleofasciculaceae cyanobacterium]|jgi:pimeloyl-ACP methyl ester carboxylesterase